MKKNINDEVEMSARIDCDLSRKVAKGSLWVTVSIICSRGLGIISSIILARLLLPSVYGNKSLKKDLFK